MKHITRDRSLLGAVSKLCEVISDGLTLLVVLIKKQKAPSWKKKNLEFLIFYPLPLWTILVELSSLSLPSFLPPVEMCAVRELEVLQRAKLSQACVTL